MSQIDGIGPYNALRIVSEIGTDMSRWSTGAHVTSWLTLARRTACLAGSSQTALGAFYRRLAFRVGKAKAIIATARKLALRTYHCLKGNIVYKDPGAAERLNKESVLRRLRQRA